MTEPMAEQFTNQTESEERRYLRDVTASIAAELASYSAKVDARQAEARHLVTELEENRSDMDHAEKANMRQSVTMATRVTEHSADQQRRLARMVDSPYFGRIDITRGDADTEQPVYIGIHSFYDAKAERQLVHDWRAPVSSMFYEYELGPAAFEAPSGRVTCDIARKRQYRIENRELIFMLDTSLNIQDDVLQAELSRASDEKMKNIVATIQRDQNAIIRNEQAHSLIIQGAAGSGKTSIALHRIAFLLYRYKDTIRSRDILIISPNKVFASYISQVLPELGEEMIQETTMEEIAGRELQHNVKFETFAEQVTRLLEGKDRKYADRVRFKAGPDFLKQLDAYFSHVRSTNFQPADVAVGLFTLDADWITARFEKYRNAAINDQISRVTDDIVGYIHEEYGKRIVNKDRTAVRNALTRMFTHTSLKALYKAFYAWIGRPDMFRQLKGGKYEYNDVFPLIYLRKLVEPVTPSTRIKHVVIDEMQDYTPVQYQVIADLYPCRKTILGDHHQSVSPVSASSAEAIERVLDEAQSVFMHKSYRSTLQITELAQTIQHNPDLMPIERHGDRPTLLACERADDELAAIQRAIARFRDSGHNSLGIICKTQDQAARLYEALSEHCAPIHLLDARSTDFTQGVMIATAYLAKGLEFDQVIVPHADDANYRSEIDRHMLYVACTRAMHRLTLTCTGQPSPLLGEAVERQVVEHHEAAA